MLNSLLESALEAWPQLMLFGVIALFVFGVVYLYFLVKKRVKSTDRKSERTKWIAYGVLSFVRLAFIVVILVLLVLDFLRSQ